MNTKDKIPAIAVDSVAVPGAKQACASCLAGCTAWAGAGSDTDMAGYQVSSRGLLQVVSVLFGLPLLGLVVVVALLQVTGLGGEIWWSVVILAGLFGLWFRLMGTYGGRLLNTLCTSQGPSSSSSTALRLARH